jgi:predicted aldo/keto reductase-like oxidoreductase
MVSPLTLGGYQIGQAEVTDEDAIRIMRTAIDEGINSFDNAWGYHKGRSETLMGKALRDGYREKVFLMTKLTARTPKEAEAQLEESLKRLQVDTIDLWQFHEIAQPNEPYQIYSEGALEVAVRAKERGKIRYIGFTGHRFPDLLGEMIERGFDWDTVEMPLNVLDHHFRSFEKEVLPKAVEKDIGVIAIKTLGGPPGRIPKESGAATVSECLRYALTLPISTIASGIDSMEALKENLSIAKNFKPLDSEDLSALLNRTRTAAAKGEFEPYKRM